MHALKKTLQAGKLTIGNMISEVRNPNVVHLLARCGYDFIIVDNEHGTYSVETLSNIIAAAHGGNVPILVRIPEIRRETVMKPLDAGAAGLLAPQVDTADQARQLVEFAKYPPDGARGVALRRPHNLYRRVSASDYLRQANEETFLAVQAETPMAIENREEIASVPGIDAIFVGPMDLSVSMGHPGEATHPAQVEAVDKIVATCRQKGLASGIMLFDRDQAAHWIEKGMRFMVYGSDISLLADAALEAVTALKKLDVSLKADRSVPTQF